MGSLMVYGLRGTRQPEDILVDLKAIPKPLGPGTVHKGFYDLIDKIIIDFPPKASNITRVLMTGHSMGGGASQCGYLIMKTLYPTLPVVCVTFGTPCSVSAEIMQTIEEPREIVNFVNEGDYIPSITVKKYTSRHGRFNKSGGIMNRSDPFLDDD